MTSERQARTARRVAAGAALVAAFCVVALVADYVVATGRAPAGQARVLELEGSVKTDAKLAAALHAERKRQTDASRGREARARALSWVLLAAGALFVGSGKWHSAERPPRLPSLDELVAIRFPPPQPARAGDSARGEPSSADPAAEIDLALVDAIVERSGRSREAAIPILQAIQAHYRYLPDEALRRVCEQTEITPAQIAGSSAFYARFRRSPVGRRVVRVCHGTACHVAGAEQITQELRRHLGIPKGGDTDPYRRFTLDSVACIGCCSLAPVMTIEDEASGRLTPAGARQAIDAAAART
jgi:NADH:ubiquinone oxidoreductase subunit E